MSLNVRCPADVVGNTNIGRSGQLDTHCRLGSLVYSPVPLGSGCPLPRWGGPLPLPARGAPLVACAPRAGSIRARRRRRVKIHSRNKLLLTQNVATFFGGVPNPANTSDISFIGMVYSACLIVASPTRVNL